MLVSGEPADLVVARSVSALPTVELSNFRVLPDYHGLGIAAVLMEATIQVARALGAAGVWLNVNQQNTRASRFYDRHGFAIVGTKQFQLADRMEGDFIRELVLMAPPVASDRLLTSHVDSHVKRTGWT